MQVYGKAFARAYNLRWGGFARQVTPYLLDFYAQTLPGQQRQPVLDLCCGTGQVALGFLERGYPVTGLDLSPHMLACARENTAAQAAAGQVEFVMADAADFALERRFGLVVSIYDALNHLPDLGALQSCFRSVRSVLCPGGWFIFDLNTRHGLRRWNVTSVDDSGETLVITHSSFDGSASAPCSTSPAFCAMRMAATSALTRPFTTRFSTSKLCCGACSTRDGAAPTPRGWATYPHLWMSQSVKSASSWSHSVKQKPGRGLDRVR
jgi:SAM-dependent methyltransferase